MADQADTRIAPNAHTLNPKPTHSGTFETTAAAGVLAPLPDLVKAEPIDDVIRRLAPLRKSYPAAFLKACTESGIDIALAWEAGREVIMLGSRLDDQERVRRVRLDALGAQMMRGKTRRPAVIALLKAQREGRRHG